MADKKSPADKPANNKSAQKTTGRKSAQKTPGRKPSNKKRHYDNFDIYIKKVLKKVHHDTAMTKEGKAVLNSIVKQILYEVTTQAFDLMVAAKKKTLRVRDVKSSIRLLLPGELAKHCMRKGVLAVDTYKDNILKVKPGSKAVQAGLQFPPSRVARFMEQITQVRHIAFAATLFMTAFLEHMVAEITELAGNQARDKKKQTITANHIHIAICHDQELDKLFKNSIIPDSTTCHIGVRPELLPKKK